MTYQGKFTPAQTERIKVYRRGLIEKALAVPEHGAIVEHQGRPGNYYFVLPGVFQPNEGCIPLIENMSIHSKDTVLDFGTGSGVIALEAAKRAKLVFGYDINDNSIKSAKENSIIQCSKAYFHNYIPDIQFNVITANLPFTDETSENMAQIAAYDKDLAAHRELFELSKYRLNQGGAVYLAQANFGAVDRALDIAREYGFSRQELVGQKEAVWNEVPVLFYAFELMRK